MKSGLRQGILSDEAVLFRCPDQQSIPFQKLNLAARSGTKITRPAKAAYMFENLKLPATQKESLIEDFILRSQNQRPITVPARVYATLSADKVNALVKPVAYHSVSTDMQTDLNALINAFTQTNNDVGNQTNSTQTDNDVGTQTNNDVGTQTDNNDPTAESPTNIPPPSFVDYDSDAESSTTDVTDVNTPSGFRPVRIPGRGSISTQTNEAGPSSASPMQQSAIDLGIQMYGPKITREIAGLIKANPSYFMGD